MSVRHFAFLAAVLFAPLAVAADNPAAPWKEGSNYFLIEPALPSDRTDGKIEVTEIFSYGCPACNFARPLMEKLKKSLPANAAISYVPASFMPNENWPMFQRAYLTAAALGVADKAHDAMFDAVWKPDAPLATMNPDGRTLKKQQATIEDAAKFYAQYGVKPEDFVATANSFAINAQMKRADALLKATGTDSTPTFIIAGKYRVTVQSAGGEDKLVPLVQYLVQRESAPK